MTILPSRDSLTLKWAVKLFLLGVLAMPVVIVWQAVCRIFGKKPYWSLGEGALHECLGWVGPLSILTGIAVYAVVVHVLIGAL